MMEDIQATQTMEKNLKRLVKNQNYFSCFFQNREPSNPFQKRLFEKKMRRSTVSCSQNYHQQSQIREMNDKYKSNYQRQEFCQEFQQRIQRTTSIVKNQIELLKQKLMKKLQIIIKDPRIPLSNKKNYLSRLAQNVQKTSSFIIQNCLHIQQQMLFPSQAQIYEEGRELSYQNDKQNIQEMNNVQYQINSKQNRKLYQSNVQMKNGKFHDDKAKQLIVENKKKSQIKNEENRKRSTQLSNPSSNNNNQHHFCQNKYHLRPIQQKQHKSIYEAVLDQRERRLKNLKKKLV